MRRDISHDIRGWVRDCSLDRYTDDKIDICVGNSIYNSLVYYADESSAVYRDRHGVMKVCDYPIIAVPEYAQDVVKIVYGKDPNNSCNVVTSETFADRQMRIEEFDLFRKPF